jgi:WD40 repeat protein
MATSLPNPVVRCLPRFRGILGMMSALGLAVATAACARSEEHAESPAASQPSAAAGRRTDREGLPLPAEALARVGSGRLRHGWFLQSLAYSPDGQLLASCGDGRLRLWDARTGDLLWQAHMVDRRSPREGRFSADGKTILALDGHTCRWFDVRSGKEVRQWEVPRLIGSEACLAPQGAMLALAENDWGPDLVIYDLPSGKERLRKQRFSNPAAGLRGWPLAFSADGRILAATTWDNENQQVLLLDSASGRKLGEFRLERFTHGLTTRYNKE